MTLCQRLKRIVSPQAPRFHDWVSAGRARIGLLEAGLITVCVGLSAAWFLWQPDVTSTNRPPAVELRRQDPRVVAPSRDAGAPEVVALTEDGIKLYSIGQYAEACQRFADAFERDQSNSTLRLNLARCFEGWGWQMLRAGRPEEANALFRQGLRQAPESEPLLKGIGLSAIHAGRPEEALEPLEAVVHSRPDAEATLLLAKLYDQRDQTDRAITLLRKLLEHEPNHSEAGALLAKLERERQAESGFWRDESRHFIVKYRGVRELEIRRVVLQLLEELYDRVGGELAVYPPEKVTVILYPEERFQEVTGAHRWASGLFDGKIRLPVGSLDGRSRALERLLTHEYTHALIHIATRGRAPRWLHEGLAQHEEGMQLLPGMSAKSGITLASLEAVFQESDVERARQGYQLALWVVRDLLARGGVHSIRQLLERVGQGEAIDAALSLVYGLPLAELERQWRVSLRG
ncbi:MAG TPA: tetratricopeptide repeat protein [Methylomirabilota bacterium]|nr:tetratricopeptide repeat protein [Methylomirabilota bacterium]